MSVKSKHYDVDLPSSSDWADIEGISTAIDKTIDIIYEHEQKKSGNTHGVTKNDVGLGSVKNIAQAPETHLTDADAHSELFRQKSDINHASDTTAHGTGTASKYGHLKLSAATTSTSGVNSGTAATPSAVASVRDMLDRFIKNLNDSDITLARDSSGNEMYLYEDLVKDYVYASTYTDGNFANTKTYSFPDAVSFSYTKPKYLSHCVLIVWTEIYGSSASYDTYFQSYKISLKDSAGNIIAVKSYTYGELSINRGNFSFDCDELNLPSGNYTFDIEFSGNISKAQLRMDMTKRCKEKFEITY